MILALASYLSFTSKSMFFVQIGVLSALYMGLPQIRQVVIDRFHVLCVETPLRRGVGFNVIARSFLGLIPNISPQVIFESCIEVG